MQENISALLDHLHSLQIPYGIGGISLPARPETGRKLEDYALSAQGFAYMQKNEIQYKKSLASCLPKPDAYELPLETKAIYKGAPCGAAHNTFHINWKGEMAPCISFYTVTSPILENGFEKAWAEIRKKMEAYQHPDECKSCQYVSQCESCPAEKCMGIPGGPLNKSVCDRMKAYAENGLLKANETNDRE